MDQPAPKGMSTAALSFSFDGDALIQSRTDSSLLSPSFFPTCAENIRGDGERGRCLLGDILGRSHVPGKRLEIKEGEMGCLAESEGVAYLRARCDSAGGVAVKVG